MKIVIALIAALVLTAVASTIVIGSRVMEPTVVKDPYESGLHYGDHHGAPRPAWQARFEPAGLRAGEPALAFRLVDAGGNPLDGASVEVAVSRPAGGGDDRHATARALGQGRYEAPLGFATPGFWDVRLDVRRGADQAGLVEQVRVATAAAVAGEACDLALGPCTGQAGDLAVTLDLGRTLATMRELPASVEVRQAGAPLEGSLVEVAFAMKDMNMGENRITLKATGAGRYQGPAVLVRCHSGRRDWVATVTVRRQGAPPASVAFPFAVRE
jgi:nitrogen fixation protein FixH